MSILGNRVQRFEDPELLTGAGEYVDDVTLPGQAAHVVYVRSPLAFARIEAVDTSDALAAPGVLAVVTAADLDLADLDPEMMFLNPAMKRPLLARDVVRFVGEPVAAVVAETPRPGRRRGRAGGRRLRPARRRGRSRAGPRARQDALPRGRHPAGHGDPSGTSWPTSPTARSSSSSASSTSGSRPRPHRAPSGRGLVGGRSARSCGRAARAPIRSGTSWRPSTGSIPPRSASSCPDVGGSFGAKNGELPEELLIGELARRVGRPVRWAETALGEHDRLRPRSRPDPAGQDRRHPRRARSPPTRLVGHPGQRRLPDARAPSCPFMTRMMTTGVYDIPNIELRRRLGGHQHHPDAAVPRAPVGPRPPPPSSGPSTCSPPRSGWTRPTCAGRTCSADDVYPYTHPGGTVYDIGDYTGGARHGARGRRTTTTCGPSRPAAARPATPASSASG